MTWLVARSETSKLGGVVRTLLLMRHAKSSWRDPGIDDHERPLVGRGQRAVSYMVEAFEESELRVSLVLSSTARRAVETANLLIAGLSFEGPLELTRRLYLAEAATYLDVLAELAPGTDDVLVIGHNPGISDLVERLTRQEVDMPTASVAKIELELNDFADIDVKTQGRLVMFSRPPREEKSKEEKGKKGKGRSS